MLKHLASGGMADVMLGRSDGIEGFERHVVLKRIRPELARDQRFIRMFLDEARVVATLHHQHIVQVYDIGEAGGEYFLAMEYVHGEDVRKILSNAARQRTHVPLGYAIAIVSAAAAGLHYAHERRSADKQPLNIVHRDVSPSNILVGYDGSIKVVDFGVASASMRQETRSGSLKGKLSYMAPEQCRGIQVDRRADVYALGVVLYELATTTRMIKGENDYLVMEQIVHGKIAPPQSRRPGLPAELAEIIMRALASDRDQRYETADDLRIALDQFATSSALTASTSAIAAYMRQQFGQRPEPWLELDGRVAGAAEDVPTAPTTLDEQVSGGSWVESARSSSNRRASTSSIPRQSGPIGLLDDAAADAVRNGPHPALQTRPSGAPPTDSRMGWENMPRVRASRRLPIPTLAVGGGGALVTGLVLWLIAGRGSSPVPPPAAAVATLPTPAVTTPQVTPLPPAPPPPAAAVAATPPPDAGIAPSAASRPAAASRDPDPTPRKARTASVTAAARAPSRPVVETPPAKPDRTTRIVVSTPEPSPHTDTVSPDPELHHPPAAPTMPPPPPPSAPTPAVTAAIPPPAAPAPVAPQVVAAAALEANRSSGEKNITPDSATMDAITRSGNDKVISSYKMCVGADGNINTVSLLKTSGFPAYDDKIQGTIRRDWHYRPYLVNGKATPVCTALRFVYSQR
ncbi:MAG TPA: protein kinase [Kofleriaceae bacterium]|jgi:serine/threonine-protein kinase|nr:protein kinase [Kofleriaceae bacterium]